MKIKPNPNKGNLTRKIFGINEEFRKKRLLHLVVHKEQYLVI